MYKKLTAESRGVTPSPSELPDYTPSLYVFSRERERKKGVNRIE